VPHDSNGGSGPGPLKHSQVLERSGCHKHFGQRMRGADVGRVGSAVSIFTISGAPAFFICHSFGGTSGPLLIP
jgi:hypothetical protein